MAIFSRRNIQSMISSNKVLYSDSALKEVLSKLNNKKNNTLAHEWEVAITYALSKVGEVIHEPILEGSSKPDLLYKDNKIEFLSEITCVSDRQSHKDNNHDLFTKIFNKVAKAYGLPSIDGFQFNIAHTDINGKIQLRLPNNELEKHIKSRFKDFIERVKSHPNIEASVSVNDEYFELEAIYKPKTQFVTKNFRVYTSAQSLQKNPVFNSLENKNEQLKKSGYKGISGIVLCDGNCDIVNQGSDRTSVLGSVINNFLKNQNTVSFIIVVRVLDKKRNVFGSSEGRKINVEFYPSANLSEDNKNHIYSVFLKMVSALPAPEVTIVNAVNRLKYNGDIPGSSFYGGFMCNNNTVRLPARSILDLLSGSLSQDQFIKDHSNASENIKHKLKNGRLISGMSISKTDQDDDWIEISFGAKDPAISKYE